MLHVLPSSRVDGGSSMLLHLVEVVMSLLLYLVNLLFQTHTLNPAYLVNNAETRALLYHEASMPIPCQIRMLQNARSNMSISFHNHVRTPSTWSIQVTSAPDTIAIQLALFPILIHVPS